MNSNSVWGLSVNDTCLWASVAVLWLIWNTARESVLPEMQKICFLKYSGFCSSHLVVRTENHLNQLDKENPTDQQGRKHGQSSWKAAGAWEPRIRVSSCISHESWRDGLIAPDCPPHSVSDSLSLLTSVSRSPSFGHTRLLLPLKEAAS